MALRHAIVEATVPSSTGVQQYTSGALSNWSGGGLALIFVSGDTGDLTFHGFCTTGLVDSAGNQRCTARVSVDASTGLPENKTADVTDQAVAILDPITGTGWGTAIALASFSSALSNGVELNWTSVAGVGSRVFKIVLLLIEGFVGVKVSDWSATSLGFQGDGVLSIPNGNGSWGTYPPAGRNANEVCPGLGGAVRLTGPPQECAYVVSDRNADPLVSRGGRRTADLVASSDGAIERIGTLSSFGASSLTMSGTPRGMFAAFKSAVGDYSFATEDLDGGTGEKAFSGLGTRAGVIVGFVCGVTSDDTFEADSSALAPFCYFVTDGVTTISLGFTQKHNGSAIAAGNPTDTHSSYSNGSVLMLDHLNATDFAATVLEITSTGLRLNVTNGLVGTMFLFGFGTAPVVEYADAVALPLVLPAPTVLTENRQTPTPVELALVLPPPQVVPAIQVAPVVLALVLPAPAVFAPPLLVPEPPPPDLGPLYTETLAALLPRGLAWPRRPLPS